MGILQKCSGLQNSDNGKYTMMFNVVICVLFNIAHVPTI